MVDMDIIAILGTGATGFSFLMLFAGYKLTSDIQNKILNTRLSDLDSRALETWEKIAGKQINNTRFFLCFTLIVLVAGLTMLAHNPETEINLSTKPMMAANPTIFVQNKEIPLDENGKAKVILKNAHHFEIDNTSMLNALDKTKVKLKASSETEKFRAIEDANKSSDSGFRGDFFEE